MHNMVLSLSASRMLMWNYKLLHILITSYLNADRDGCYPINYTAVAVQYDWKLWQLYVATTKGCGVHLATFMFQWPSNSIRKRNSTTNIMNYSLLTLMH